MKQVIYSSRPCVVSNELVTPFIRAGVSTSSRVIKKDSPF